jgi:hypothetical protein
VKTTRLCSVPRTARTRATAAPRTTRPVALTPRRERRRLWQEKQATLRLRHNDRVKKGTPRRSIFVSFSFSSLSPLQQGPGKGDTPKRILLREGTRLRASLLIRGSKAGPSEGFNSRLRARGLHTHYWSEVRRPAPRKGSTTASGYSGSAPTTDLGFEGWPKAGPRRVHSRLRHRARDDPGYVRYITKARATLPRYPRTFPRPAGTIL